MVRRKGLMRLLLMMIPVLLMMKKLLMLLLLIMMIVILLVYDTLIRLLWLCLWLCLCHVLMRVYTMEHRRVLLWVVRRWKIASKHRRAVIHRRRMRRRRKRTFPGESVIFLFVLTTMDGN